MPKEVVDLDNCAREPIHIPGSIQPHGILMALRIPDLKVIQVSENCAAMLGISAEEILEAGLEGFLSASQIERVRFGLESSDPTDQNPVPLQMPTSDPSLTLDGVVHQHDGFYFLELEPTSPEGEPRFLDFYKNVSRVTARLQAAPDVAALSHEAAEGIRRVTGFDRVMVYRFAHGGEGEVIAEAKAEHLESFYGLWYPASDIPEQARRLYLLSPIRAIVNATYTPAPLFPAINPISHQPTDLSFAALRSVSPIHCEYLRNMGVTASMSVSIVCRGKLWGLLSCHHHSPKFVPYETRKACTFLGQVLSGEIVRRESEAESAYQAKTNAVLARLLESMARAHTPLQGLTQDTPNLLDLIPASGAAVITENKVRTFGVSPGFDDLVELTDGLKAMQTSNVFATNSLHNHLPSMDRVRTTAAGLISLEISKDPTTFILFFRPEVTQTVKWGGDPNKPVTLDEDGMRLSPRKSFALWKEVVLGASSPWTPGEIAAASELKKLVLLMGAKGKMGEP